MKRTLVLAAAAFLIAAPDQLGANHAAADATADRGHRPQPTHAAGATHDAAGRAARQRRARARRRRHHVQPPRRGAAARARRRAKRARACPTPSRIGTSTAHPDGHNVCVRPS